MPGLNGMGPTGAGPRTGRGLGLCPGGPVAGARPGMGWRGRGFGFGRGFGRGYYRGYYYDPYYYGPAYNKAGLKDYESYLENELKNVRQEMQRTDEE